MTSWRPEWETFPQTLLDFWTERHLCTLTTLRADGRPHVTPVGVALDLEQRCAWVITSRRSWKAIHVARDPRIAACQVDGRHWSTLEGSARVLGDADSVRRAETMYAARYKTPRPNPERVALRIDVERFVVSQSLAGAI